MSAHTIDKPASVRRRFGSESSRTGGRSEWKIALVFIAPALVGFLAFFVYPTIRGFYFSLTQYNLAQHRRFFTVDADCVACTPATDWGKNRQFLDLVARSGTALFVSVDPASRTDAVDADLSAALRLALDGGQPGGVEPVDWLHNPTPATWRSGNKTRTYTWYETPGADAYDLTDAEPGG